MSRTLLVWQLSMTTPTTLYCFLRAIRSLYTASNPEDDAVKFCLLLNPANY